MNEEWAEIFSTELMSISGGLLAGILLAVWLDKLFLVPGIFIMLPGFLAMRGNISGSLFARLNSSLHLGVLEPRWAGTALAQNVVATFLLALLVSGALGIIAYTATALFFGVPTLAIIWVALLAGIISNGIEIPLTVATTFALFKRGYDPANVMGPYVTTIGDVVSVVALLVAIVLIV